MLASILDRVAPGADAVATASGVATASDLRAGASAIETELQPWRGARIALDCRPLPQTFAALLALERAGVQAVLVDDTILAGDGLLDELDISATLAPDADGNMRALPTATPRPGAHHEPGIVVLTSGTTGRPKPVVLSWDAVARGIRGTTRERWGCGYRLRLFAAGQVLVQAWSGGGCFVAGIPGSAEDTAALWAKSDVTAASATPSFWRRLLMGADPAVLAAMPLHQITMGGEPADQAVLDHLRARFPSARLTHIYATTELGRCFAVSDGRAGFPAAWLTEGAPAGGPGLAIDAGELIVHTGGHDHHTGDLVTVEGDRVQFAGRRDEVLNVGGEKVSPVAVERRLRELAEIADVRVFGRRSSIVGQLIACEVVAAPGVDAAAARAAVERLAQAELTAAARPRFIDVVEQIALSAAGKALRGAKEN